MTCFIYSVVVYESGDNYNQKFYNSVKNITMRGNPLHNNGTLA